MKTELDTHEAANLLINDPYAGWSRAAAFALVEYYESLEEELGESIELDRVAIRCDWTEYKSALEASSYFDEDFSDFKEGESAALAYFMERTTVIIFEGGVLIQQF